MKDNISLHRIKLLLRADWMKHKTYLLYAGVVYLVIAILLLVIAVREGNSNYGRSQSLFYWAPLFGYFIYYCRYVGMKVHREKGLSLTLPASTLEKYISLLLEGIILICGFHLFAIAASYGIKGLIPDYPALNIVNLWSGSRALPSILILISAMNFLSYVTFRKYPGLAMAGVFIAIMALIGLLVKSILYVPFEGATINNATFSEMTNTYYALEFLFEYHVVFLLSTSLVIMYIAYLKLKEKEIR